MRYQSIYSLHSELQKKKLGKLSTPRRRTLRIDTLTSD
jgi:hypothetical protein